MSPVGATRKRLPGTPSLKGWTLAFDPRLMVCGTCARCVAAGACQSDWPLRAYATAHAPDKGLHSECWRGGALGWVPYWIDPEEEKQNVLADMKATGYLEG